MPETIPGQYLAEERHRGRFGVAPEDVFTVPGFKVLKTCGDWGQVRTAWDGWFRPMGWYLDQLGDA